MVSIRLSRGGAKKRPFYHIVVTDSRNRRDGRFIERLGFFNPIASGKEEPLRLNLARANYWLSVGAQPSERVSKLIKDYAKKAPTEQTANGAGVQTSPIEPVSAAPAEPTSTEAVSTETASTEATPQLCIDGLRVRHVLLET
jgi:small subunit ribosomal protein S16